MTGSKCTVELPVRRRRRRVEIDTGAAEESFSMRAGSASTRKLVERGTRVVVIKPNGKQRAFGLIQVVFGGWHEVVSNGGNEMNRRALNRRDRFPTYQVNLVLKDPPGSRTNVANQRDRNGTEETARQLAEFLDVPVLNQLSPQA